MLSFFYPFGGIACGSRDGWNPGFDNVQADVDVQGGMESWPRNKHESERWLGLSDRAKIEI